MNSNKESLLKSLANIDNELASLASIVDNRPLDFIESLSEAEYIDFRRALTRISKSESLLQTADIVYKEYLLRQKQKL